jgi:ATP-dependent Clp protease protease subunit
VLSEKTGQTIDKVTQDSGRTKYMDAQEALNYGIIDKVLQNEDDLPAKPSFLASL